jgi:ribose transport system substrate-binding protein
LPNMPVECFVRIDGRGMRDKSYRVVLEFLKRHPKDKHILVAAANDTSAMGAVAAVRELKREKHVVIVGQDCVEEMLHEMQRPDSPAIASISHDVALYGSKLIELGLALLRGETVAPYNYAPHRVVTADAAGRMLEAEFATGPVAAATAAPANTKTEPTATTAKKHVQTRKTARKADH